ncbi:hypothetical protein U1Q18_021723, partial [Sarracenia purpurea var. burkii]
VAILVTVGSSYSGAKGDIKVWNPFVESDEEYTTSRLALRNGPYFNYEGIQSGWAEESRVKAIEEEQAVPALGVSTDRSGGGLVDVEIGDHSDVLGGEIAEPQRRRRAATSATPALGSSWLIGASFLIGVGFQWRTKAAEGHRGSGSVSAKEKTTSQARGRKSG